MKARWDYHSRDRDRVLRHHLWRLLLLGAISTVKGLWRVADALKKRKGNIFILRYDAYLQVAWWKDWTGSWLFLLLRWLRKEREQSVTLEKCHSIFIGFCQGNGGIIAYIKFWNVIFTNTETSGRISHRISNRSTLELGGSSTEGSLIACTDLGKGESDQGLVKDFCKRNRDVPARNPSQRPSHREVRGAVILRDPAETFRESFWGRFDSRVCQWASFLSSQLAECSPQVSDGTWCCEGWIVPTSST